MLTSLCSSQGPSVTTRWLWPLCPEMSGVPYTCFFGFFLNSQQFFEALFRFHPMLVARQDTYSLSAQRW